MTIVLLVLGLLFIGLAIPFLRRMIGPNRVCGLRVRETLESEKVWYEANARSAKNLMWAGIGLVIISSCLFALSLPNSDEYVLVCSAVLTAIALWLAWSGTRIAKAVKLELETPAIADQLNGES